MRRYYNILEEWEDQENNQDKNNENQVINPEDCIDEDVKFKMEK